MHPSLDELGALADRCLAPAAVTAVQTHLEACARCFEAYAAAVEARVERRRAPPRRLRLAAARWRRWPLPAAVGVAAVLAAVMVVPAMRWRASIGPVRAAMAISSCRGLQYPDVRPAGCETAQVYRSGTRPDAERLSAAIHKLSQRNEQSPHSWRTAYWLVAARMEADQLRQARSILDGALRRSRENRSLQTLDGMLAYREGRLEASAAVFEALARSDPGDAVAAQNLARVRAELQQERAHVGSALK